MKTHLLLFITAVLSISSTYATHYRAADITYKVTGNNTIEATVTTYSKYDGISINADKDEIEIYWGDGSSSTVERSNGVDSDGNGFKDGEVISINPENIKKNVYVASHTYAGLPPAPQQHYILGFMDLNRIDGINNIQAGNSIEIPLYIVDTIFVASFATADNSSPVFLNPAVCYANLNDPFSFNLLAYDADGDSITFELITPLQSPVNPVPDYSAPDLYCQANGFPGNSFQLNAQTGQLSWVTPCRVGIYNIAVKVSEYRCDVQLSTVMCDLQIIVLNQPNDPPVLPVIVDTIIAAGDSISFNVSATDANNMQTVSLEAIGGAFFSAQNPPVFQQIAGNPATGLFTWQTNAQSARSNAYIFSVIARDNYLAPGNPPVPNPLSTYQTFRVWVTDNSTCNFRYTNVEQLESDHNIWLYPNPVNTVLNLNTGGMIIKQVNLYNSTGQLLYTPVPVSNSIDVSTLSNGVYTLKIELNENDNSIITQRFIKM
ncbi:MAG TPA: T9SS type A sorting domain-containing protein [Chitinophagales bacterium]|nr:T9SS type A sorting domain-containing protein [Chitinophagales bacterium]